MLDVICVGSATSDRIALLDRMPTDDQRVLATSITDAHGGPAATAAVTLARLGVRVGFCGVVGEDEAGDAARRHLESEGVVTDWLTVDPDVETARSMVLVSTATESRAIVTVRAPAPWAVDIPLSASTWLHVDHAGHAPTRAAIDAAAGTVTNRLSLDGGNPIDDLDLRGIDLYAPSVPALLTRYPSASGVDDALRRAREEGAAWVVATDGSRGSYYLDDVPRFVDSFAVDAVSTLGAGDVFHGALLASLVFGRPLDDAVREANAVAALSCRGLDGRSAIPDTTELRAFLGDG
jgi:sulfofructose kinase